MNGHAPGGHPETRVPSAEALRISSYGFTMNLWEETGEHEMREIGGSQWAVPILRSVELSSEEQAAVDDPYNLPAPEPRVKVRLVHVGESV